MVPEDVLPMSDAEMEVVRAIAKRDGVSEDVAASRLAQEFLKRTVKRRTGNSPARIYTIKPKDKR